MWMITWYQSKSHVAIQDESECITVTSRYQTKRHVACTATNIQAPKQPQNHDTTWKDHLCWHPEITENKPLTVNHLHSASISINIKM